MDTASTDPELAPGVRPEFSIDELARKAGTTVRNVRAYQDRGLLPPPQRRGRKGIYDDAHLSRLRIIGRLLERGYTLSNIGELIETWERGNDISQLLGLESAVASPWTDEVPDYVDLPTLLERFGASFSGPALDKAIELDLIQPEGPRYRVPSPRMLYAGAELVKAGIPLEDMLDVVASLRENVEEAADAMVKLVATHVFDAKYGEELPPASEMEELADLVWRLRPLVEMAVLPEVARAMEKSANRVLGDRLAQVLEHMHDRCRAGPSPGGPPLEHPGTHPHRRRLAGHPPMGRPHAPAGAAGPRLSRQQPGLGRCRRAPGRSLPRDRLRRARRRPLQRPPPHP